MCFLILFAQVLDSSFHNDGRVYFEFPRASEFESGFVQNDGNFKGIEYRLRRYFSSGQIDSSFGDGGIFSDSYGKQDFFQKLIMNPDGSLFALGHTFFGPEKDASIHKFLAPTSLHQDWSSWGTVSILDFVFNTNNE